MEEKSEDEKDDDDEDERPSSCYHRMPTKMIPVMCEGLS